MRVNGKELLGFQRAKSCPFCRRMESVSQALARHVRLSHPDMDWCRAFLTSKDRAARREQWDDGIYDQNVLIESLDFSADDYEEKVATFEQT